MGFEIARSLAAHGAEVIGTARSRQKATAVAEAISSYSPGMINLRMVELDLAALQSVRSCAADLISAGGPIDVIIANAGVMAGPLRRTAEGYELQFGTNHLGHFVLINRLTKLMRCDGRVITVSSAGHRRSDVDLSDPNFENTAYDEYLAYGRSKTAVILCAVEFDRRHLSKGIRATAVHPGAVKTATVERMIVEQISAGNDPRANYNWKTIPQGAATAVWAAVAAPSSEIGGRYCEDCRVALVDDDPKHTSGVRSYALDSANAEALWLRSEELCGERF